MISRSILAATVALAALYAVQSSFASDSVTTTSATSLGNSKHNNNAPIHVASDHFEGDLQTKIGTYVGNVIVTQDEYKLRADRMNVHIVNGKASTIDGAGNVLFNSGIETASGDTGVYDLNAHTVTMDGKVVLTKEKNVMRGTHLVMNMDTHKALLTAKGMPGGGRVQSMFIPEQKNDQPKSSQSQTTGKPPAK